MLLYIIRHGDPIYVTDTLTEKGQAQAQALKCRFTQGFDRIYSSPMGRARATAQPTCDLTGIPYQVEEWTSEWLSWVDMSVSDENGEDWVFRKYERRMLETNWHKLGDRWYDDKAFRGLRVKECYQRIVKNSDDFLLRQGYRRDGSLYIAERPNDERVAVFCHHGFGTTWLSHLLRIPAPMLWTSFDITHTGVTVLRFKADDDGVCTPVCLCYSDMSHILKSDMPMTYNNGDIL